MTVSSHETTSTKKAEAASPSALAHPPASPQRRYSNARSETSNPLFRHVGRRSPNFRGYREARGNPKEGRVMSKVRSQFLGLDAGADPLSDLASQTAQAAQATAQQATNQATAAATTAVTSALTGAGVPAGVTTAATGLMNASAQEGFKAVIHAI